MVGMNVSNLLIRIQFSFKHYYGSLNSHLRLLSFLSILFTALLVAFKANSLSFLSVFDYAATGGRSCMFLICNGIVGILVKDCSCSSSSSSSSSLVDDQEMQIIALGDQYAKVLVGEKGRLQAEDYGCELLSLEANELDREENSEEERENQELLSLEAKELDREENSEEELELDDEEELSAIEFNTKCEDFIKMMWSQVKVVSFDESL